jgi:ubiquinone/menaquinone biosynthesis C-methylase UbiE
MPQCRSQAMTERIAMVSWEESAELYDRYSRRHPTYAVTSAQLVSAVADHPSRRILDLACGTGTTSAALIGHFGREVQLVAADASEAMLCIARANPSLGSVRFTRCAAESLGPHVGGAFDLVVCNCAFWMMRMPTVLRAVESVLAPDGLFAFNCPGYVIATASGQSPMPPLMAACIDAGSSPHGSAYALREQTLEALIERCGLRIRHRTVFHCSESNEETLDALGIPAIRTACLPTMAPDGAAALIDRLSSKLDPRAATEVEWHVFVLGKRA